MYKLCQVKTLKESLPLKYCIVQKILRPMSCYKQLLIATYYHPFFIPPNIFSILFLNPAEGSAKGKRTCGLQMFIRLNKYFTPVGLPSSYMGPLIAKSLKASSFALL